MAKRTRTVRRLDAGASDGETKDLTTFSLRLNDEDRDHVVGAAALRGWSPTNLIRTATVDRATHILNTSRSATFKGLAVRIAEQLFRPRMYEAIFVNPGGEIWEKRISEAELEGVGEEPENHSHFIGARPVIEALPGDALTELRTAVRLGGAEFLTQIIEYSEGLAASARLDVTGLIDPDTTK